MAVFNGYKQSLCKCMLNTKNMYINLFRYRLINISHCKIYCDNYTKKKTKQQIEFLLLRQKEVEKIFIVFFCI